MTDIVPPRWVARPTSAGDALTGGSPRGEMRPMAKPLKCERCGRENDPSLDTCLDCGGPLPRPQAPPAPTTCARCGAQVLAGFRFCGRCGTEVGHTPAPDAAVA